MENDKKKNLLARGAAIGVTAGITADIAWALKQNQALKGYPPIAGGIAGLAIGAGLQHKKNSMIRMSIKEDIDPRLQ